jgi:hypothetical protein
MISKKDLKFRNNPPADPHGLWIFTYGPLNFWKKFTTHNFPKKYLKLWYNPPINPNLKKKAFNFPQINKTPK